MAGLDERSLNISIGPLVLRIKTARGGLPDKTLQELEPFISGSKAGFEVKLDFCRGPRARTEGSVVISASSAGYSAVREDFSAEIGLSNGEARFSGARNPYTVNSFLRILCSLVLPRKGALIMHASGAALNGRAHIFAGKSGAGKSTIVKNISFAESLGDEIVGLKLSAKKAIAFSTPFGGELDAPRKNFSVPAGALYMLKKSKKENILNCDKADYLGHFLRCVVNFSKEAEDIRRVLGLAARAVRVLPCRALEFKAKSDFSVILGAYRQ